MCFTVRPRLLKSYTCNSILPQKQPDKALVICTQVTLALQLEAIWKKVYNYVPKSTETDEIQQKVKIPPPEQGRILHSYHVPPEQDEGAKQEWDTEELFTS